ncbi:uncharacterized protein L969DRAFT_95338 [Mixia osmundae IAM 14324]|uniref:Uncharacterized protein n=1 Tax=Mixia osmundae (strain CBS 9802 / IAM 14324 / JCM 22182 / KY 12970) TaxID=764103 RepID=G7DZ29_MIXOS|nr:uncharacterized protein L969DRAFT_95338 [Mixia osmundae IAM 14324]KEI38240.1 hypothetical protein L969DRAFT_95338 [Mixia osmundae IAM 14324]GAA95839.1 hypothetical protein E5Q_02496 [Mixia osmundae IAM 14324]
MDRERAALLSDTLEDDQTSSPLANDASAKTSSSDERYFENFGNRDQPSRRHRRWKVVAALAVATVVVALVSSPTVYTSGLSSKTVEALSYVCPTLSDPAKTAEDSFYTDRETIEKLKGLHIAVEEVAGYHGEVVAATLYAAQGLGSRITLFRDYLGGGLDTIVGAYYQGCNLPTAALIQMLSYGPWKGSLVDDSAENVPGPPTSKHIELNAANNATLEAYFSAHPIEVLLLSSCSESIGVYGKDIVEAWDARPFDAKFQVVCTIHHADRFTWGDKFFGLEQRGALKILTLNKAAQTFAYDRSMSYASSAGERGGLELSFDSVLIRAFAPIFPVPGLPPRPANAELDSVVVQGGLSQTKRDYAGIFSDMQGFLEEDASLWGYRYDASTEMYEEDTSIAQPFKIHLIGSGRLAVPMNISKIAIVQSGLDYISFYRLINSAQLLMPAFNLEGYLTTMASSSIAAAVLSMTPVLADNRIMRAYSYLNERNAVIKPFDMSDMQAVRRLKFGESLVEGRPNAKLGQWRDDYWQLDVPSVWADRHHTSYARTQAEIDAATRDIHQQNRKHLAYTILN